MYILLHTAVWAKFYSTFGILFICGYHLPFILVIAKWKSWYPVFDISKVNWWNNKYAPSKVQKKMNTDYMWISKIMGENWHNNAFTFYIIIYIQSMHSRLNEITQTGLFTNIKHIGRIIIIIYHLHTSDKKGGLLHIFPHLIFILILIYTQ